MSSLQIPTFSTEIKYDLIIEISQESDRVSDSSKLLFN